MAFDWESIIGEIIVEENKEFTDDNGTGVFDNVDGDVDVPGTILISDSEGDTAEYRLSGDVTVNSLYSGSVDGDVEVAIPLPDVELCGYLEVVEQTNTFDFVGDVDVLGAGKSEAYITGEVTLNKITVTADIDMDINVIAPMSEEIEGELTVKLESVESELSGDIDVALTTNKELSGDIDVSVKYTDELLGDLDITGARLKDLGGSIVVSGDYLDNISGDITVLQKASKSISGDIVVGLQFKKDLFGEVEVEAKKTKDIDGTITVAKHGLSYVYIL